jgi:hypothetical protein
MAHGDVSDFIQQKRDVRSSIAPDAQNHLQDSLVYGSSHPLRNGSSASLFEPNETPSGVTIGFDFALLMWKEKWQTGSK